MSSLYCYRRQEVHKTPARRNNKPDAFSQFLRGLYPAEPPSFPGDPSHRHPRPPHPPHPPHFHQPFHPHHIPDARNDSKNYNYCFNIIIA